MKLPQPLRDCNTLEQLILQQETLRKTDWTSWREFVLKTVSMSPVMQETRSKWRDFYSQALTDLIDGERQGPF